MNTHEELRAKIDEHIDYGTCGVCDGKCYKEENIPWLALRAVVELHKPENVYLPNGLGEKIDVCEDCQDNIGQTIYPCPTIQAIEKELQ